MTISKANPVLATSAAVADSGKIRLGAGWGLLPATAPPASKH
jgi:hypothetical protein